MPEPKVCVPVSVTKTPAPVAPEKRLSTYNLFVKSALLIGTAVQLGRSVKVFTPAPNVCAPVSVTNAPPVEPVAPENKLSTYNLLVRSALTLGTAVD